MNRRAIRIAGNLFGLVILFLALTAEASSELPDCDLKKGVENKKKLDRYLARHLKAYRNNPDAYFSNDDDYKMACLIYHWMDPKKMDSSKATERYDRLEEIVKKEGVKKGLLERLFKQTKGYKEKYRRSYKRYLRYVEPIQALLTGDAAVYEESLKEIPADRLEPYQPLRNRVICNRVIEKRREFQDGVERILADAKNRVSREGYKKLEELYWEKRERDPQITRVCVSDMLQSNELEKGKDRYRKQARKHLKSSWNGYLSSSTPESLKQLQDHTWVLTLDGSDKSCAQSVEVLSKRGFTGWVQGELTTEELLAGHLENRDQLTWLNRCIAKGENSPALDNVFHAREGEVVKIKEVVYRAVDQYWRSSLDLSEERQSPSPLSREQRHHLERIHPMVRESGNSSRCDTYLTLPLTGRGNQWSSKSSVRTKLFYYHQFIQGKGPYDFSVMNANSPIQGVVDLLNQNGGALQVHSALSSCGLVNQSILDAASQFDQAVRERQRAVLETLLRGRKLEWRRQMGLPLGEELTDNESKWVKRYADKVTTLGCSHPDPTQKTVLRYATNPRAIPNHREEEMLKYLKAGLKGPSGGCGRELVDQWEKLRDQWISERKRSDLNFVSQRLSRYEQEVVAPWWKKISEAAPTTPRALSQLRSQLQRLEQLNDEWEGVDRRYRNKRCKIPKKKTREIMVKGAMLRGLESGKSTAFFSKEISYPGKLFSLFEGESLAQQLKSAQETYNEVSGWRSRVVKGKGSYQRFGNKSVIHDSLSKRYLDGCKDKDDLISGGSFYTAQFLDSLRSAMHQVSSDNPIRTRQQELRSKEGDAVRGSTAPPPVKEERPVPSQKQPAPLVIRHSGTETANNRDGQDNQKICEISKDLVSEIPEAVHKEQFKAFINGVTSNFGCFNRQDAEKPRSKSPEMKNNITGGYLITVATYMNKDHANNLVNKLKDNGFHGSRKYMTSCDGKTCFSVFIDGYETKKQAQSIIHGTDWRKYGFKHETPRDIRVQKSSRYR